MAFFSLVGASIYLRRKQLGYEPSKSPERTAARAETERLKVRARMVDDVFQLVRIGKHVDATAPLAHWLRDLDAEHVSKDTYYIAEQSLKWESPAALNPIGSTLIRHLMRYGRPDAALAVFEILRSTLTQLHDGFRARPAHAGRICGEQRPRSPGAIHAAGDAGLPARTLKRPRNMTVVSQPRLTATT